MKIDSIEGNTQKLDGGSMFGNAPKEMWKKWVDIDEKNRIPLAARSLLIRDFHGRNLLFEAGIGAFFEPKLKERYGVQESEHLLLKNLQKLNISEEEIDGVILSHLHFDHAGGLLPAFENKMEGLHFPNATYYVGVEHWKRAENPHRREKASFLPELYKRLEESGRLKFITDHKHPDLPNIQFKQSDGHTLGLLTSEIETDDGLLVIPSDLIPGVPWVHLPITMGYDRFPEKVVDEKTVALKSYLERDATLFFVHDPTHPFAKLKQNEKGRYEAIITQFFV